MPVHYRWSSPMALKINPVSGKPYSERYYELKEKNDKMPMNQPENIDNLNRLLDTNQVIVLSSATGSGKTTTINQHMLNYLRLIHGPKVRCIITQPRRAAASEIPDYVAKLMDVTLGEEVGYKIKNDVMANDNSAVTFVTEGIMRRMLMYDPLVSDFNAVILDECHELTTDLLLVLLFLKRLVASRRRPDLKIVLMSATANIDTFMDYFGRCGRLNVPGKLFSIQKIYSKETPSKDRIVKEGINRIARILNDPNSIPGDILFFLSGKQDLADGCLEMELLRKSKKINKTFKCLEFSSATNRQKQNEIMKKDASHWEVDVKVVMATNVAEASLTIDGIVYVVDCGRANVGGFDIAIQQKTLEQVWVSQAQIGQRVGRAGRTQAGIAYLLYTEEQYDKLHPFKAAEILSEDLTGLSLQLLSTPGFNTIDLLLIGYSELIAVPSRAAINAALQNLAFLGALDSNNMITPLGQALSEFTIEIEMARSLIFSRAFQCYYEMVRIAAMASVDTQVKNFFFENEKGQTQAHKFQEAGGELMTLLQIYVAFEEVPVEEREAFCKKFQLNMKLLQEAEIAVEKLRRKMRSINLPPLLQGNQVIVNIPYYQVAWLTSRVNPDDVRHNIVRALLVGHFMNVVISQNNKTSTLKTNVFVKLRDQKRSALALYAGAVRMNDLMNLNVSGLTEIQGAAWLLDAASHYLATVEIPEQKKIINELRLLYDVTSIKYTPTATAMSTSPMNSGLSPVDPENTS